MLRNKAFAKKIIAVVLVMAIVFSNYSILAVNLVSVSEYGKQENGQSNQNIIFDTSFVDKNEEKGYVYQSNINNKDLGVKLKVGVLNAGYLKNASVRFDSSSKLNFKLGEIQNNELIESNTENSVKLNQINVDKALDLIIPITYVDTENIDNLKNNTEVTLSGTYVDNKGNYSNVVEKVVMSLSWLSNSKVTINSKVTKFVKYSSNNSKGLIAQTELTVGLDKQNMPIDKTEITLDALKVNEATLERITIISNEREDLTENDWNYDEKAGKINISVSNKEVVEDTETFIITYIFKENTKIKFPITYNSLINCNVLMEGTSEKISGELNAVYNISKEIGDIVTYSSEPMNTEISKGNIIANKYNKKKNYVTDYSYKYVFNVAETTLLDKIVLKDINETAKSQNDNKYYSLAETSYYKEVKISKTSFDKILGENGIVEIYNMNGEKISTISKDSKDEENAYYTVNISDNKLSKILIITSKPINVGNLEIITSKSIQNTKYNLSDIKTFNNILGKTSASIFYEGNIENNIGEKTTSIKLNDTKTNAVLSIDRESLGTIVKNKDVELKVELNNNKLGTDFYKDPIFEITLPKEIKEITVKKVSVINADEAFKIKNATVIRKNGNIIVKIELDGTQTSYSLNDVTNGTNILINTDITIDSLTPSKETEITLNYINKAATKYESSNSNYGTSKQKITYAAPSGLLSINKISNYDNKNSNVVSVEQGEVKGKLEIYSDSKISKMDILVMNNNENIVKDVKVLGRIPFKGNKDVETGKDLGTTVDTTLVSKIIADASNKTKATIYYSSNGEATSDLENQENAWTTDISDLSKVKSYLIVCNNDYEMDTGDILKFSYNYKIPANLEHNEELYGSFATYYTNVTEVSNNKDISVADTVGLVTGKGPQLVIETKLESPDSEVSEYQYLQYAVTVNNKGEEDAKDVVINVPTPKGTTFATYKAVTSMSSEGGWTLDKSKEKKYKIGTLKPNESKTCKFYVQVNKLPTIEEYYGNYNGFTKNSDGTYSIYAKVIDASGNETYKEKKITSLPDIYTSCTASVTAKDLSKALESNKTENKVKSSDIIVTETAETETKVANINEQIKYKVSVKNTSKEEMKNIKVEKILPNELSYVEAYVVGYESNGTTKKINSVSYDKNSRKLVWTVDSLEKGKTAHMQVIVKTNDLPNGIYEKDIVTSSKVKVNDKEYKTTDISTKVGKPKLVISQMADVTNKYVTENQIINYKFTVKNEGLVKAQKVSIVDKLPSKVKIKSLSYKSDGIEMKKVVSNNEDATVYTSIQPNSELVVNVKAVTLSIDREEETIENYATVSADNVTSNQNTNKVMHTIERSDKKNDIEEDDDNGITKVSPETSIPTTSLAYKITGSAWLDTDKNGQYTKKDVMISNLETVLINASTGKQVSKTTTSSRGTYTFNGISKGKYYVGFYYNAKKYGLTEYKKKGIAENLNSDAYVSKINKTAIALTDIITVNKTSISNIDIGLVEATVFDLSLTKKVSKITVQNKSGTKKYTINSDMAKIDIPAKYLANSKVFIEYSIKVKNEGELIGYAKQVIDYKEKGLTFSQDLNSGWYEGSDGNLYSEALSKKAIHPGETVELKLVLVKQMTESNTGIINNTAEITKSYNASGVADRDSTPNNKVQSEDDYGSADTIISVKTGESLIYTSVILTITVASIIAIYVGYKNRFKIRRVLRKRKVVD